jgi:hypothetical protein
LLYKSLANGDILMFPPIVELIGVVDVLDGAVVPKFIHPLADTPIAEYVEPQYENENPIGIAPAVVACESHVVIEAGNTDVPPDVNAV